MDTVTTPRATMTVGEAATEAGIGRGLAYEETRRTGQLLGVPVLRIGRRVLVPRQAFERVLAGRIVIDGPAGDGA